jgi:hypothetical protein
VAENEGPTPTQPEAILDAKQLHVATPYSQAFLKWKPGHRKNPFMESA